MGLQERQQNIKELQELRGTRVIVHINSDRRVAPGEPGLPALQTKLATEAQPFFYKALREVGHNPKLDLFLHTSGGQTDSVWPLVSLFREFGQQLNVLVPYKAHSAGTLVCLGADTVVMGEAGELSPVDPQTGNQFNPVDEINKTTRRGISVEDVTAFFDLAADPGKTSDQREGSSRVDTNLAFQMLAQQVHPLALGNVNRSHRQIRELARRLLATHRPTASNDERSEIDTIVNTLTQGRYSHTDVLNRREAQQLLGDHVVKRASEAEQKLMWKLYEQYAEVLSLDTTFSLQALVGDEQQKQVTITGAFIETEQVSFVYKAVFWVIQRSSLPAGFTVQLQPGQQVPLIPGFPRELNADLRHIGWVNNEEGV